MSLAPGTRIGVYDVSTPLGDGGMGGVYRARDSKLNRDVAIKVLPEAFAADGDRLARFTREAQTLAALNHPNIAFDPPRHPRDLGRWGEGFREPCARARDVVGLDGALR